MGDTAPVTAAMRAKYAGIVMDLAWALWRDPGLDPWLSDRRYRHGLERSSQSVFESLLGRPLSPDALLEDMARMGP